jgi:hypothetical protein
MSDAVDKNYFWITAASGIIDGKKTDILKMIDATRIESYNVITDYTQLERINETIEFFELDRHFVDTWIIYDDVSAGPPGATTKRLLESATRVLLDSKMGQTIYNNDTFFYPQKDGIFLLLITDGATQGFKILKLKALQPKESGEIIFSFTCELVNEEMYGIVCSNPLIIENGVKISQEQAFKSNPIFLKALEMFGVLEPLD